MAKKPKFYVVWRGRQTGVFTTWAACQAQIQGYRGAEYKSFSSRALAEEAFSGHYDDYVGSGSSQPKKKDKPLVSSSEMITPSLSVDAACSGNPGIMEFRGVDTETKEQIFHFGPYQSATNNIGEFLAIVHALRLLKEQGSTLPIYTDSKTAMAWVRNHHAKTTLEPNQHNQVVFEMIEDAVDWLNQNTYDNQIIKWPTESWGEIPADFGRK